MKTTLALAIVVGLVVTLSAAAASGGETPKTGPRTSDTPAKDTVTEEQIRELAARYFADGVEAYADGDLKSARSDLRAALRLDPTHSKAKSMLEIVEEKLGITDKVRLNERLQARVTDVNFTNAPVKDVVEFLAREGDINIVFDASALQVLAAGAEDAQAPPLDIEAQPEIEETEDELPPLAPLQPVRPGPVRTDLITIHLKNVPLGEVLKYVLRFKGLKYIVEDYAILIVPVNWVDQGELETEIFRLTTSGAGAQEIVDFLTGEGGSQRAHSY